MSEWWKSSEEFQLLVNSWGKVTVGMTSIQHSEDCTDRPCQISRFSFRENIILNLGMVFLSQASKTENSWHFPGVTKKVNIGGGVLWLQPLLRLCVSSIELYNLVSLGHWTSKCFRVASRLLVGSSNWAKSVPSNPLEAKCKLKDFMIVLLSIFYSTMKGIKILL